MATSANTTCKCVHENKLGGVLSVVRVLNPLPQHWPGSIALQALERVDMTCQPIGKVLSCLCVLVQDQKYKEGCSLIEIALLHIAQARPQDGDQPPAQPQVAVQC